MTIFSFIKSHDDGDDAFSLVNETFKISDQAITQYGYFDAQTTRVIAGLLMCEGGLGQDHRSTYVHLGSNALCVDSRAVEILPDDFENSDFIITQDDEEDESYLCVISRAHILEGCQACVSGKGHDMWPLFNLIYSSAKSSQYLPALDHRIYNADLIPNFEDIFPLAILRLGLDRHNDKIDDIAFCLAEIINILTVENFKIKGSVGDNAAGYIPSRLTREFLLEHGYFGFSSWDDITTTTASPRFEINFKHYVKDMDISIFEPLLALILAFNPNHFTNASRQFDDEYYQNLDSIDQRPPEDAHLPVLSAHERMQAAKLANDIVDIVRDIKSKM